MEVRSELDHAVIREFFESLQVTGVPPCTHARISKSQREMTSSERQMLKGRTCRSTGSPINPVPSELFVRGTPSARRERSEPSFAPAARPTRLSSLRSDEEG